MRNCFLIVLLLSFSLVSATNFNYSKAGADTLNGFALFPLNGGGCGLLEHDAATGIMNNASFSEFSRQGVNCISLGAYYSSDGWTGNGVRNPNKFLYFQIGPFSQDYTVVLRKQDRFSFKAMSHGNSIDSIAAFYVDRFNNHTMLFKSVLKANLWETFVTEVPKTSIPVISSFRIYAWSSTVTPSPVVPGILSVDDVQISFGVVSVTSTSAKEDKLFTSFNLSNAYPNPFNPSTTIEYTVPASTFDLSLHQGSGNSEKLVTLKVYDALGREVSTLVDENKSAGTYKITFNVKTLHAASLPSGIYFYRLTAGSYSETKKLVLLK